MNSRIDLKIWSSHGKNSAELQGHRGGMTTTQPQVKYRWISWHFLPWELKGITSPCSLLIGQYSHHMTGLSATLWTISLESH